MASIRKYTSTSDETTYRVLFRINSASRSETFATRRDAERFVSLVAAVGGARARAIINEHDPDDVLGHTLGQVADLWIAWKSETTTTGDYKRVRAGYTLTRYRQLLDKHVRPTLGDKPVNLVSESDVQTWVDRLSDDLAPKTVRDAHWILHAVYRWAGQKSRGLTIIDPCEATDLPRVRKRPPKGLRPAEWQILHRAAESVSTDAADLLLFLVATGWRWSEATALQSMDIDDVGDAIYLAMGRVLRRTEHDGYEFAEDESKSEAGFRRTKVLGIAHDMIRRRRSGLGPGDLLLTNRRGGKWYYSHFHQRIWTRSERGGGSARTGRVLEVAAELGLDRHVTLHMLRHTHVGLLILAGENLTAIQRRVGHADIRTTSNVYGTMVTDASDEALDAVNAMLAPPAIEG